MKSIEVYLIGLVAAKVGVLDDVGDAPIERLQNVGRLLLLVLADVDLVLGQ